MKRSTKTKALVVTAVATAWLTMGSSCGGPSAAERANENLSKAADNFEVPRRIVGINAITGDALFSVEGFCSYSVGKDTVEAVCLINRETGAVERTTLGRADNVTFVSTQLQGVEVDLFRPRVIFRPETLVPNFDLSTSSNPTEP